MPFTRDPFQGSTLDNDSYLGKTLGFQETTISNQLHEVIYFFDPEIPKDDLGFCLAAVNNHHTGKFKNKVRYSNIRHWTNSKKKSIHSIQRSIMPPHTTATNGGYS
ncbi:unnamed protein product [Nyctereutes procyonoides]|uniref:(raccoon dog) hypothetical protein n=1 Tax=Nyctereutes procyonoides TaxID=34880 RepID=A0A811Z345_NYCPR|nr:unnamed protein product [Nyctereutes procyonoides]